MKPGAFLINNSRGTVVDLDALAAAAEERPSARRRRGRVPGRARVQQRAVRSPLQGLDNVILTPHIGGSTAGGAGAHRRGGRRKLIDYSDVGSTVGAVNFPQVQLPPPASGHALHPRPSQCARHARAAERGVLAPRPQHRGAVPADRRRARLRGHRGGREPEQSRDALDEIRALEGTIRARLLY